MASGSVKVTASRRRDGAAISVGAVSALVVGWSCVMGVLLGTGAAGCKVAEQTPFDPRAIRGPERERAAEVGHRGMRPLPTTLESPYLTDRAARPATRPTTAPATSPALGENGERVVRLTLQECVQRAASNNLDVRVAAYTPAIDETKVTQAEANFDPVLFITPDFQYQERATAGSIFPDLSQGTINTVTAFHQKTETFSLAGGIRQNLPTGGQARLTYTTAFTDNRPKQFLIDPFWENTLLLEVQQPILRGFGSDINRARINIARNQQRISLLDFRQALEKAVSDVETTYWQLAQAEQTVHIQEALLQRTVESAQLLQRREAQDATRVQTSQANATLEQRRVGLIQARVDVRNLSTQLKQLVNDPELSVSSAVLLLPANQPSEEAFHFDLEDQVATALDNRLELAQQQVKIDSARIAAEFYKNNRLPQLNLILNAGFNGVNDDPWEAGTAQGFIGRIGFQFEVPIGNREAEALYQQQLLQRAQAIEQYSALVSQIVSEVTQARDKLYSAWDAISASRQSRFASAEALRVILLLEASEQPKNPEFIQLKLQRQQDLADSARAEAAALSAYNIAIAELERAKGTLLRYNNIVMEHRPEPFSVKPTLVTQP